LLCEPFFQIGRTLFVTNDVLVPSNSHEVFFGNVLNLLVAVSTEARLPHGMRHLGRFQGRGIFTATSHPQSNQQATWQDD